MTARVEDDVGGVEGQVGGSNVAGAVGGGEHFGVGELVARRWARLSAG
jgi:hypothetical protein